MTRSRSESRIAGPSIAVSGISKRFLIGEEVITAVDDVSLQVSLGQFVCVYGSSGSGKTTLLSVISGIDVPDSGEVRILGQTVSSLAEGGRADIRLRHIGVVFQSNNLLPEFTASENVGLPLMVRGLSRSATGRAARDALRSVGVLHLADRLPGRMSGGQRQRVGIARALAGDREVLVADEPTGALDTQNSLELFRLMRTLCTDRGVSVVLATHDPLARDFADVAYVMTDGRISAA